MLKIAEPRKSGVGVGGNSRVGRGRREIDRSGIDDVEVEVEFDEVGKKVRNLFKSRNLPKSKKIVRCSDFLTPKAKLAFIELRQTFFKALILPHFNPECHIRIETDVSGYAIGGFLNQLTLDDSGRWHPVAFFSRKMIPAETRYETYDGELLAIVEVFKTWRHYLEGSQHEVLVLTNYNNLRQFMDTKSLSSRQFRWAQKLSCYYFHINYCQNKANGATDTLSQYLQRSAEEEKTLRGENVKILHCLQSLLINASLSCLTLFKPNLSSLYQVLVCKTYVFHQLNQFWDSFQSNIARNGPYTSIGDMNLLLSEL